jgi:hypothetical protein
MQLDEVLGPGFAWLAVLGPGELMVSRPGQAPSRWRTVDGLVHAGILDAALGHELLVRPDRYVAAVVRPGERTTAMHALATELPELASQFEGVMAD